MKQYKNPRQDKKRQERITCDTANQVSLKQFKIDKPEHSKPRQNKTRQAKTIQDKCYNKSQGSTQEFNETNKRVSTQAKRENDKHRDN